METDESDKSDVVPTPEITPVISNQINEGTSTQPQSLEAKPDKDVKPPKFHQLLASDWRKDEKGTLIHGEEKEGSSNE